MKALRKTDAAPGIALLDAAPPPPPAAGEVLLRVHAAGICGTDLHIDHWSPGYRFMAPALPVTLGHEFSGHVESIGANVRGLVPGMLVAVRPSVVCGVCAACASGRFDDCTTRTGLGVTRDGGFAPWVNVPARNCVAAPPGLDADIAALAEPLTVSYEAVRVGGVRVGDRVLVIGPGNIGQGISLFAREAGAAKIVIAGRNDASRMAVLSAMGFGDLLDVGRDGLDSALAQRSELLFDVVFEASGASAVVAPALRHLRPHGTLVIVGIHPDPVPIDLTALVRRQHTIRGSYRAPESAWPEVLAFARREEPVLRHMITDRVPLSEAISGFTRAHARSATKVLVTPGLDGTVVRPERRG